jgi:hypothetical protein
MIEDATWISDTTSLLRPCTTSILCECTRSSNDMTRAYRWSARAFIEDGGWCWGTFGAVVRGDAAEGYCGIDASGESSRLSYDGAP